MVAWQTTRSGALVSGNAETFEFSARWGLHVDGDFVDYYDTSEAACAAAEKHPDFVPTVEVEGAALPGTPDTRCMLGIFTEGGVENPDYLIPGFPSFYTAPRFAKAAGRRVLAEAPAALGFDVIQFTKPGSSNYRTVATEMRAS